MPIWYAFLSMIGVALCGIVLSVDAGGGQGVGEGIFVFSSVVLSLSLASFVLSSVSTYLACKADVSEGEAVKLTTDAREAGLSFAIFVLASLLLAISAIVISLGTQVPVSSYNFAAVVLAVSGLSVIISLSKAIAGCVKLCRSRVAD